MAYFSNGTEGDAYAYIYCRQCVHSKDKEAPGVGCPVMDAHWIWAYELCNDHETPGKKMLEMLIPGGNGDKPIEKCKMFYVEPSAKGAS